MWVYERAIQTAATPAAVWAMYADARNWPRWDRGLERAELAGPLATGARGWVTPTGQERWPFAVTWAEPDRGFTVETPLMGHVLRFGHTIEAQPGGGVVIRHRVEVEGPAEYDFGPNIVAEVLPALAALAALAERVARAGSGGRPEDEGPAAR